MSPPRPDPVLVHARREAVVVMLLWAVALAWTIGYCATNAYGRRPETLTFVAGVPDWVFYGLLVPWLACAAFTVVYCGLFVPDDDWGEEFDADADRPGPDAVPSTESRPRE